ncbi:hypothetical protein FGADI_6503 [Fusarium gaditjirri]|uniref:Uncharacterized protein n=1 Tax=Fusarium gaditjirri TaxID=282569 RepID=A0A8H4T7G4_9HYPO|nr:hypothetical protein FGADI_6503 [Fusarium gaditjirri]
MDPIYREKLTYSLSKYLMRVHYGQSHSYNSVQNHVPVDLGHDDKIKENLAVLDPEDFLSQALRYYQRCSLDPKGYQDERILIEIIQCLEAEYREFLKGSNLLEYTAQPNWLEEALKVPGQGRLRWKHSYKPPKPAETPNDKHRTRIKYTIDREMEEFTEAQQESRPKDLELLTFSPAKIEESFSFLKPFDYTEGYSLHYILLRKYSGDGKMTHQDADREAQDRLAEYKAEHFERMREESRQLKEWEEREEVRDWKYWKEIERDLDSLLSEDDESEEDGSEDGESGDGESEGEESEDEGSEDEGSGDEGSGSDGDSNSPGMDIDLPEPTDEDLTTQISVLQILAKGQATRLVE